MKKIKNAFKKTIASILVVGVLFSATPTAFAASSTPMSAPTGYEEIVEAMSKVFHADELVQIFGTDLAFLMELPQKDDTFYEDLLDLVADSGYTFDNPNAPMPANFGITSVSETSLARATSFAYARSIAQWSVLDDGRGLDVNQEAVYMYLSHYIDRQGTYWDVFNNGYLLDGPSMSTGAYLAKWITDYDRQNFDLYLGKLSGIDLYENFFNLSTSMANMLIDPLAPLALIEKADSFADWLAAAASVAGTLFSVDDLADDLTDTWNAIELEMGNIDDPEELFSLIYEVIDEDKFDEIGKSYLRSAIASIICIACAGTGLAGLLVSTGTTVLVYINTQFTNFFDYVAWLSLGLTRQSRLVYRMFRSYGWDY